jgi:hypothetical protein
MDGPQVGWRDKGNKGNGRCSASTASGDVVVVADLDPKPLSRPEAEARHARGSAGQDAKVRR